MKKKLKMKIKWNQRKLWLLVCIMLILAVFSGCGKNKVKNSPIQEETLETMEEPLRIFYDGTGEKLLRSFINAHPEINIMLINCLHVGTEIDMEEIINKNGVPDLIIAGEEKSGCLPDLYHEEYIADLGEYCANDTSIVADDYFPETFEVFREEEKMYALPLGISVDFMLTSESKYNDSAFAQLPEGYTGRELVNALLEEVQKEKELGEFFSEINVLPLVWMSRLNGITQTEDGIQMDEELFKQLYEFTYQNGMIQTDARRFWNQQGEGVNGSSGFAYPCAMDPRRYEGRWTVDIGSMEDPAALILSYAESAYQYHIEEGIKAIYIPTADDGSKYEARVKMWGAVAEESTKKELAYELLRELMDTEINNFGMVRGVPVNVNNVYPIKKANAMSLLENFEEQTAKLMYENDIVIDRIDVSAEEKEKHEKMLNSISGLYCLTNEMQEISQISRDYFDANISDYKNCYLDMLNALNSGEISESISDANDTTKEENEDSNVVKHERNETAEAKELKEVIKNIEIGDTFYFGETEQDNSLENGAEPIEWIVLEKEEDKVFVISKMVIEWLTFSKYDDEMYDDDNAYTWDIERNQQRIWLTNELYTNGFSENEKEIILLTHNVADELRVDEYIDYLYIPSQEEVEVYMQNKDLRKAEMTAYAAEKAGISEGEYVRWSLRTEAASSKSTMQINEKGEFGSWYCNAFNGVRPVMWLDIG